VSGSRYIARCSYGNDSIAMLQLMREHGLKDVMVVYSDTGWASENWEDRVARGEAWVSSLGWSAVRLASKGFEAGVIGHSQTGMFPTRLRKWCTKELKIRPFLKWVKDFDPDKRCLICVGVRRAESDARKGAQAFMPEHDNGRHVWHPIVEFDDAARDAMILKTPFEILPHRSDECEMCINNNRLDFKRMTERAIVRVEDLEAAIGQPMFHPGNHMGATGIREVIRWAHSERGKFKPAGWRPDMPLLDALPDPGPSCEDGWCGL
jgi:3'-phosphoadenosine 5'-phosphosulfate sulfotransferase (PAPS reductase)/FAD synthetase